jgi:hypothetical protein
MLNPIIKSFRTSLGVAPHDGTYGNATAVGWTLIRSGPGRSPYRKDSFRREN